VQFDGSGIGGFQEFDSSRNALVGRSTVVDYPIRLYENIFH